ncbi:MAG: PAS domain S-box protein [Chitinophagaceae bacterium]
MENKIKILIAEHDANDIELIHDELLRGGINYDAEVIHTEKDYINALRIFIPDIILADYSFPSFDGPTAFNIREKIASKTPFIIVSGIIGEEKSIELIKSGVTDYVLKDKLFTLVTKIKRALKESTERQQQYDTDLELRNSEKKYRQIVETAQEGIWLIDENNYTTLVNQKMADMLGYTINEMLGKQNYFFMDEEGKKKATGHIVNRKLGMNESHDFKYITKSGKEIYTSVSANPVFNDYGKYEGALAMVINIDERKRTEREIGWMINNTEESFILLNKELEITSFNDMAQRLYSKYLSKKLIKGVHILEYAQASRVQIVKDIYKRVLNGSEETDEISIPLPDGSLKHFSIKYKPAKDEVGIIIGVFVSAIDTTEKKKADIQKEFERRDKEALINTTSDLIWSVSSDFKLIAANKAFINSLIAFNGVHLQPGDELLIKEKFPPEYLAFWKELYTDALSGKAFIKEIYFPGSKYQAESWGEINFNPIYDGNIITGIACYSRNTTVSKNFNTELIDINKKLATAQQIANLGYWELDMEASTLYWTNEVYNIWGVSPDTFEVNFKNCYATIHRDDRKIFDEAVKNAFDGKGKVDFEHRILLPSGKIKFVQQKGDLVYDRQGSILRLEGTVQDITERKELENMLNKATKLARIGSWEVDLLKNTLYWSDITKEIHETEPGYTPDLATAISFYREGKDRDLILQKVNEAIEKGSAWDIELQIITTKGNEKWIRSIGQTESANGKVIRIGGSFQDIDTRKRAEVEVTKVLEEKNTILESIDDAFFAVDKNWTVTYWNSQSERLLRKQKNEVLEHNLWDIFSDSIDTESYKKYHQALETAQSVHFEDFYPPLEKWYEISAYPSGSGLSVYFKDVSERKLSEKLLHELNEDLQKQAKELSVSNKELEQFAYVASHDLQEPLRMITSFLTQLEKKYGNIIDDKGKEYIGFAVDGAKRMRQIILDLLEFSRVGSIEEIQETLDLNELVNEIKILYRKKLEDKNATVEFTELPVIQAMKAPLLQVFQNLIGNALKYSRENIPSRIQITSKEFEDRWEFAVKDNGIGIREEYFDQIFIIFQRLHNKNEYSGTGMGLAITKKIIENLGGKIWVESEEGIGSTFYFTIKRNLA